MKVRCAGLVLFVFGVLTPNSSASTWHYESEDDWPELCRTGQNQSPINLDYTTAIEDDLIPFKLINYNALYNATITNNGHSVQLKLKGTDRPEIAEGGLPDVYVLEQIHFHWESEHTINNERLPLEMHLVHYAKKYGAFDNAVLYPSGVAVLGVLFDISRDDDEYFEPFVHMIPLIEKRPNDDEMNVPEKLAASTFIPRDHAGFFRYEGSLTTPDCNEGVIWTIFTQPLPISLKQVYQFQRIWTDENSTLTQNYRSLQSLNGRPVFLRQQFRSKANATKPVLLIILLTFGFKYLIC